MALQWYRNRLPWMTLNGNFALKYVSGLASNGLASPAFGQNCSKICRATIHCQRQKCSPGNVVPGNVVSGSIRFMRIFARVPWGEGVKWDVVVENGDFRFFRSLSSEHFYRATLCWARYMQRQFRLLTVCPSVRLSFRLSVCHTRVLYQNGWTYHRSSFTLW